MDAIPLLILSLVLISVFFSIANYLAWRLFERPRHALIWSVAFSLAGIQYGLNLVRSVGLLWESAYWLLANMLSFALVLCALWGHRQRLALETPVRRLFALFVAMAGANALIVFFNTAPGPKVAIAPAFTFIVMTQITLTLLRQPGTVSLPQKMAAGAHFLFGLTQVAAAAIALSFRDPVSASLQEAYHLANFALMPALYVAIGVSIILLLATDLSERLRVQALTDQLTGLSNRRGFFANCERLLARAQRAGRPVTMILCDLDHFKQVNDTHGHSVGDKALQQVSDILQGTLRLGDEPGRIGGEEFAICIDGMAPQTAAQVARRIQQRLADAPISTRQGPLTVTASFGVAAASPEDTVETLLQHADHALYAAKDAGRDTVKVNGTES